MPTQLTDITAKYYGKDSREHEMAGGVRKSDRVRRSANSRIKAQIDQREA